MVWSYLVCRLIRNLHGMWQLLMSAGRQVIPVTLAAGVLGTMLSSLIRVGGWERQTSAAMFQAAREKTARGTPPVAAFTPSPSGPREAVPSLVIGRDLKNSATGATQASQPGFAPSVPISGRIVDWEGRPVAGATVRVTRVMKARRDGLTLWIDAMRSGRFRAASNYLIDSARAGPEERQLAATSDAQGRFRLGGIGAEQVLTLTIHGPTIASMAVSVITRRTEPIAACGSWIYGAEFVVKASTTRPVEGFVMDAQSRQPLGGVEIRTDQLPGPAWISSEGLRTITDANGRFRLVGLPNRWSNGLAIIPNGDQPYIAQAAAVANANVFDLRLISSTNESSRIPQAGKSLVVIAVLKSALHFRIFDDRGKAVVNTDEQRLPREVQMFASKMLRKQLQGLWPPHELTRGEKDRIISLIAPIVDYSLPEPPDMAPVQLEIELHRGIWIEGKITDKETRAPVAGVAIRYVPLVDNRFARILPEFIDVKGRGDFYEHVGGSSYWNRTEPDGTYHLVGLPGRGILSVLLSDKPYLQEGDGGLDAQGRFWIYPSGDPFSFLRKPGRRFPTPVREINPPEQAVTFRADFELVPGGKVRLRVIDPQGKPVSGARVSYLIPHDRLFSDQRAPAEFDVRALGPNEVRLVLIRHEALNLGKAIHVRPGADRNGPVLVTLEPLSTLVGGVTEADGEPATAVIIRTRACRHSSLRLGEASTDAEGRFRVSAVPAGCQYEVSADDVISDAGGTSSIYRYAELPEPVSVRPGQITNVGTIRFARVR